jgi:hypothetical protein
VKPQRSMTDPSTRFASIRSARASAVTETKWWTDSTLRVVAVAWTG